ncbi:MAG: NAD(P)H-hydrate dehydratase [Tatlockia sp.]|jgi:NAD(P)H-hydrate epimerase
MSSVKTALYQTQQIRACEQKAIEELAIPEDELMARAGTAAFAALTKQFPNVRNIAVFCGSGNNAGDGYVLARIAKEKGFSVVVHQYKTAEHLPPAACHAALRALAVGVNCQELDEHIDSECELIVDALLGIGLTGDVQGSLVAAINQINESRLPVLALDIPSGLDADTGKIRGVCVKASVTVTFIGRKLGLMTLDGVDNTGICVCHDLHLAKCLATIPAVAYLLTSSIQKEQLRPRLKNAHKGLFGHVLIIGGNYGMPGSVCLAAEAAMRVGAGSVTIATRFDLPLARLPEAMVYRIEKASDLNALMKRATVCVIGPGLGEDEWAQTVFTTALASQLPMVIDAQALRFLAEQPQYDDNWVLTPHPGEAAKLLDTSTAKIQDDRYQSVLRLQKTYGGNVVLKGAGSLIAGDESVTLCPRGNPGMSSAGMGDVLSGVIAGLIAQGILLPEASQLGVWLHACAGDAAALEKGERGLLASDLMPHLHRLVNE